MLYTATPPVHSRRRRAPRAALSPGDWTRLIARLGEIPDPAVGKGPSSAAIPDSPQGEGRSERWQRLALPALRPPRQPGPSPPAPERRARPSRAGVTRWLARRRARHRRADRRLSRVRGRRRRAPTSCCSPKPSQLVRGDQVQVGGVPVGRVTEIALTQDYKAKVTIHVDSVADAAAPGHARQKSACRRCRASPTATSRSRPGPTTTPRCRDGATLPGQRDAEKSPTSTSCSTP